MINRLRREDLVKKDLLGATILTKHGGNKLYTIHDVDFNLSPKNTFYNWKEKKEMTYADYFKNWYSLDVKNLNQPLLVVETQGKRR